MCALSKILCVIKIDIALKLAYELLEGELPDSKLVACEYEWLLNEKFTDDNPTDRDRNTK